MSKLLDHFKAMQGMVSRYIEPTGVYKSRNGTEYCNGKAASGEYGLEETAFINDMIYMLDGPEQREAERWDAANQESLDEHEREMAEMRGKVAVANSDRSRATEKLAVVKAENNDLRSRLFDSELAYAKLRGYLDRVEDERPPRMVPEQRERAFYPDGTRGTDVGGWAGDGRRSKPWYHR